MIVLSVLLYRSIINFFTELLHSGQSLEFKSPTSNRGENSLIDAPLLLDKYFSQGNFGAGEILLRPGAEKGTQHVRRDTMVGHACMR